MLDELARLDRLSDVEDTTIELGLDSTEDAMLELELDCMEVEEEDSRTELEIVLEARLAEDVALLVNSEEIIDDNDDENIAMEELLLDCTSEELVEDDTEINVDVMASEADQVVWLELEEVTRVELAAERSDLVEYRAAVLIGDDVIDVEDEDATETEGDEAKVDEEAEVYREGDVVIILGEDTEGEECRSALQSPNSD